MTAFRVFSCLAVFSALAAFAVAQGPGGGGGGGGGGTGVVCSVLPGIQGFSAPNYFCGTNCRAICSASPLSGDLSRVTITVSAGTVTKTALDLQPGPPDGMGVWTPLMFDSTGFPSGLIATVKVEAWTTTGGHNLATMQAEIKNRFLFAGHPDPEIPGLPQRVGYEMLQPGFWGKQLLEGSWSPAEFSEALAGKSAVYVDGHGNVDGFLAGAMVTNPPNAPDPTWVYPFGLQTELHSPIDLYRQAQIGTGFPPFNVAGYPAVSDPAITLAYLETCTSGYSNNFIRFCIPYMNAYGKWLEDQALMAYPDHVYLSEYRDKATVLFVHLLANETVFVTRQALVDDGRFTAGTDRHQMILSDSAIYGDGYTRLTGVYTKTNEQDPGWYRFSWPLL